MNSNGIVPTMPINGNDGWGNSGEWIFGLIILAAMFNGGLWGGNNNGNLATTEQVSTQAIQGNLFDLSSNMNNGFNNVNSNIQNGFQNTNNAINSGFANTSTGLCNVRSDILTGNMGLQNTLLDNKYSAAMNNAETQRDILMQTQQLSNQSSVNALQGQASLDSCCCQLKAGQIENTQKILDAMNQNTIDSLREQVNDLKNTITAQGIGTSIVNQVRPFPTPSYLVSSPYQSIYNPYGVNYGYGNGFFGNTIV